MLEGPRTFRLNQEISNEFVLLQDNYSCKGCGLYSWIFGYEKSHTAKYLDILNPTTQKNKCNAWNG